MKKSINPLALEIQRRFFQAFDVLVENGTIPGGLKGFCNDYNLNRTKYSRIKNALDKPMDERLYKIIDIDALAALCGHFGVSAQWLLLGKGKMLQTKKKNENKLVGQVLSL